MPFISQSRREAISLGEKPEVVGELCYLVYVRMMARWQESRRWTTAHDIYRALITGWYTQHLVSQTAAKFSGPDYQAAAELAWQVFFAREVMKYEEEKAREHGEI